MIKLLAFLLTWVLLGMILGWSTHSRTLGEDEITPEDVHKTAEDLAKEETHAVSEMR